MPVSRGAALPEVAELAEPAVADPLVLPELVELVELAEPVMAEPLVLPELVELAELAVAELLVLPELVELAELAVAEPRAEPEEVMEGMPLTVATVVEQTGIKIAALLAAGQAAM